MYITIKNISCIYSKIIELSTSGTQRSLWVKTMYLLIFFPLLFKKYRKKNPNAHLEMIFDVCCIFFAQFTLFLANTVSAARFTYGSDWKTDVCHFLYGSGLVMSAMTDDGKLEEQPFATVAGTHFFKFFGFLASDQRNYRHRYPPPQSFDRNWKKEGEGGHSIKIQKSRAKINKIHWKRKGKMESLAEPGKNSDQRF